MKTLTLLALVLTLSASVGAVPRVDSVQGVIENHSLITINGNGFGPKALAAPYRWDDFDSGTLGQTITGWETWSWQAGKDPRYSVTHQRSPGSQSAYQNFTGGNYNSTLALSGLPDAPVYLSGWFYFATSGAPSRNVKLLQFRAGDLTDYVWDARLDQYLILPDDGGHQYITDCDGSTIDGQDWAIGPHLFNDSTWHHLEAWLDQGTVGGGNGVWQTWVDGKLFGSVTGTFMQSVDCPFNRLWIGFYFCTDTGTPQPQAERWWDELYVDQSRARIELSDEPMRTDPPRWSDTNWLPAGAVHREIQVPVTWTDGQITARVNTGSFVTGTTVYLYVIDGSGTANSAGLPITLGGAPPPVPPPEPTPPPVDPPPATVGNLAASPISRNAISVTWTESGDDCMTGTASTYDLRRALSPITEASWSSATKITGTPKAPWSKETVTVTGLSASTTYYFGLKVTDDAGNVSGLSNVASARTKAR